MALPLAMERFGDPDSGAAPLLIAHGLFGSARNWASLAKRFAAERAVAAVDLRNHGASPWDDRMDYPAMAEDLLAASSAAFGRPAVLLGHSMGGKAAMTAALTAPGEVAGLIVADIAPVAYPGHDHGAYVEAMRTADLSVATKRSEIDPQLAEAIPEPALRAFILANLVFEHTADGRRARWRVNLEAVGAGMRRVIGWPEELEGKRYSGPSLFFHGGASDYVGPEGRARIGTLFPAAEIKALDGAGHWMHAEQPDAFYNGVAAWLVENRGALNEKR